MKHITADVDYIIGHLRYGHYELDLSDEEYEDFKNMSIEEQEEWIEENGKLVINNYKIDDIGSLGEIHVYN